MSKNISSVTNKLPTVNEGFVTTTSSTTSGGAGTIGLNSTSGLTNGSVFVGIIEPGADNQQTFTGLVDTSGNQITSVVWTRGSDVSHPGGSSIVDYVTGTDFNLLSSALQGIMNQNGTLKAAPIQTALGVTASTGGGWDLLTTTPTVSTGYNKGNKEFDLTFSNVNLSTALSPGMRLKVDRTGTVPTQCTDLESTSSQYWSKSSPTGISFTDDFTCEAWIKLESYTGANQTILRKFLTNAGFGLHLNPTGQVRLFAGTGGAYDDIVSYQSIPLGQWVHIVATLDMSASSGKVYINGVDVPASYSNSAATQLTQAGNLYVGAAETLSEYFDGEISNVRIWSAIRTATQVRDNMAVSTVGNETNLVVDIKFSGNGNDSTSNANNLTASGGATATTTDNPFKATEYAIVTKVNYSAPNTTVTVITGTDYNIPNMTLQNPYYSTHKSPYGFPSKRAFTLVSTFRILESVSLGAVNQWFASNHTISIPSGEWIPKYQGAFQFSSSGGGTRDGDIILSDVTPTNNVRFQELTSEIYSTSTNDAIATLHKTQESGISLTTQTTFRIYGQIAGATGTEFFRLRGDLSAIQITAESAYV